MAALCLAAATSAIAESDGYVWAKGNLHCHSNQSDGDVPPNDVAAWYKDHGYDFLVLTDHRKLTDPASINSNGLVMVRGEELDTMVGGARVHLNGIGINSVLKPKNGPTVTRALQWNIDQIRKAGGVAMINHPSWPDFPFGHREMLPLNGAFLLEIQNVSGGCNNEGDPTHFNTEQMWDILLSAGKKVYATASDDTHNYKEFKPALANPGRGWVVVRVKNTTPDEIVTALGRGDFYCSTGVQIEDIVSDGKWLTVSVKPQDKTRYTVLFIGKYGQILSEVDGVKARCAIPESGYVRAKIVSSDGKAAWTQAIYRK